MGSLSGADAILYRLCDTIVIWVASCLGALTHLLTIQILTAADDVDMCDDV